MDNKPTPTGMCRIRRFRAADYDQLVVLAEQDNHHVMAPTHVIEKDGKMVGYLAIASIPMLTGWLDTKQVKVRDSLQVINFTENMLVENGATALAVPCPESSPFFPLAEHLGFVAGEKVTLFLKAL